MNILEELWYGNICPIEQTLFRTEDRKDLLELYDRNHTKLDATLNAEEKETLEKMRQCLLEMQQYGECNAFIVGFRLGVQLMTASVGPVAEGRI